MNLKLIEKLDRKWVENFFKICFHKEFKWFEGNLILFRWILSLEWHCFSLLSAYTSLCGGLDIFYWSICILWNFYMYLTKEHSCLEIYVIKDSVSNQYTYFDMSTCQKWPQVTKGYSDLIDFWTILMFETVYLHQTFTNFGRHAKYTYVNLLFYFQLFFNIT